MVTLPNPVNSLWLESYGPYKSFLPFSGQADVDVAVIGGGYTGLMSAYEIKKAEPSLRIAVLEAQEIGYGASGRNGSFGMTVIGLGFGVTAKLRGREFLRDAHHYMMRAVDRLDELIRCENLDCEFTRPGFLRVATTKATCNWKIGPMNAIWQGMYELKDRGIKQDERHGSS